MPNDGITPTFKDEATGEAQDFTKPLYAVVNYGGDSTKVTANITPLTNLAATVAGVDTSTNKMTVPDGKTADQVVKEANTKVAQKFGLDVADLTSVDVHTTNSDKANDYGVALAIISKMEQSKTQDEVAAEFKKAVNGENSTFTSSLQTAVTELKKDAGTNNDYLKNIANDSKTNDLLAVQDLAGNDATTIPETTVDNNVADNKPVITVSAGQSFGYKENQTTKGGFAAEVQASTTEGTVTKFRFGHHHLPVEGRRHQHQRRNQQHLHTHASRSGQSHHGGGDIHGRAGQR